MNEREQFFTRFNFRESGAGLVGVEREQFTIDPTTMHIVPGSNRYLDYFRTFNPPMDETIFRFGYELSACQLESKIGPCCLCDLGACLNECEDFLVVADSMVDLTRINIELAPENMPLDIYPDPTGRYQVITKSMPREVLSAACRVAATHVHIGMPSLEKAIEVYNRVIPHTDELIAMGDGSSGERMNLYKVMASRFQPMPIDSPEEFYRQACAYNFVHDPRTCWTMIRISVHGTIEFRMFGATESIDQVVGWAFACHSLCF